MVVLVVLTLLAGWGAQRLGSSAAFEAAGVAREMSQMVRLGQRLAIAQQREIFVSLDASQQRAALCWDARCAQPLAQTPGPALLNVAPTVRWLPPGWTLSFTAQGVPALAQPWRVALVDTSGAVLGPVVSVDPRSGAARVE